MTIFHQPIDGVAHHRRRPISFVAQRCVEIGRGDMGLVRAPLASKGDHGSDRVLILRLMQRPNPLRILLRFQEGLNWHKALVRGIRLHERAIQGRMMGDQLLLDRQRDGFIKQPFEQPLFVNRRFRFCENVERFHGC